MAKYTPQDYIDTIKEWFSPENVNDYELEILEKIAYGIWRRYVMEPPPDDHDTQVWFLGCVFAAFQLGKGSPIPDAFFEAIEQLDMSELGNSELTVDKINSLFENANW